MGLRKGQTNNPAGKPAGRLNKMSKELRLQISDFLEARFPEVIAEFEKLEGKDKARLYVDLLPYGLPRLQMTELKVGADPGEKDRIEKEIERIKKIIDAEYPSGI
jgi:hypothetical protein